MVFDDKWFKQKQGILLRLLNGFTRSSFLSFLCVQDRGGEIVRITPESITWVEDGVATVQLHSYNRFARRLYYGFKHFWDFLHFIDLTIINKTVPELNLGYDTVQIFDTGVSGGTDYQYIIESPTYIAWYDLITGNGSGLTLETSNPSFVYVSFSGKGSGGGFLNTRFCTTGFDFAGLVPNIGLSINMVVNCSSIDSTNAQISLAVAGAVGSLTIPPTTLYSSGISPIVGQNNIPLNTSVLGAYNLTAGSTYTGKLYLSLIDERLITQVDPPISGKSATPTVSIYQASNEGTSLDPYLLITYKMGEKVVQKHLRREEMNNYMRHKRVKLLQAK